MWSFTTGAQTCLTAVDLGSAASFGAFGGAAGVTNQGIQTTIGGNLGSTAACTLITGLHDAANVYTETPLNVGAVNGSIYCAPPAPGTTTTRLIAQQALADAQRAYDELAALPPGSDIANPTVRREEGTLTVELARNPAHGPCRQDRFLREFLWRWPRAHTGSLERQQALQER